MATVDVANQLPVPVSLCTCPQKVRISQCTKCRYNYFRFRKTNGRHIEILLPVSTLTYQSLSASHLASAYQISCESDHWRPSYDVILIFKMADVSHVVMHVRLWWTTHDVTLMVWVSSSNFGLMGCTVSEISPFLDFRNLAWKCLFTPLLGGFLGHIPPNNVTHHPNPKKDRPWAEPRHYFEP